MEPLRWGASLGGEVVHWGDRWGSEAAAGHVAAAGAVSRSCGNIGARASSCSSTSHHAGQPSLLSLPPAATHGRVAASTVRRSMVRSSCGVSLMHAESSRQARAILCGSVV